MKCNNNNNNNEIDDFEEINNENYFDDDDENNNNNKIINKINEIKNKFLIFKINSILIKLIKITKTFKFSLKKQKLNLN